MGNGSLNCGFFPLPLPCLGSHVNFDTINTPGTGVNSIYYNKKHRFLNIIFVILASSNWEAKSKISFPSFVPNTRFWEEYGQYISRQKLKNKGTTSYFFHAFSKILTQASFAHSVVDNQRYQQYSNHEVLIGFRISGAPLTGKELPLLSVLAFAASPFKHVQECCNGGGS